MAKKHVIQVRRIWAAAFDGAHDPAALNYLISGFQREQYYFNRHGYEVLKILRAVGGYRVREVKPGIQLTLFLNEQKIRI